MFYLGILFVSLMLGYLIGASNSPVVGSALTAMLGLVGVLFGAKHLIPKDPKTIPSFLGKILVIFAIGVLVGELVGESFRLGKFGKGSQDFPWKGAEPPASMSETLDWIVLKQKLLDLGYSDAQVSELYGIRLKEVENILQTRAQMISEGADDYELPEVYDTTQPFSDTLEAETAKSSGRGPASVD